ncbi:MAG TPA: DeoR/GlpR family DNA-binding transcription regulator [Atribacteraceae bacterium]|nr:DeoR/GlpR family DNA-binding transcription regulator [Atribacteraceae bacterium]
MWLEVIITKIMMKKRERINVITNALSLNGAVRIREISKKLGVSEMTIRRDLDTLSQENIATVIPGGAILKKDVSPELDNENYLISTAESRMIREKIRICQKAAAQVKPNDTLIIDTGSTTEHLMEFIPPSVPLTIICFTLNILTKVCSNPHWKIIFTGGYFHGNTLMFESAEGISLLKKTRANKAFLSAAGIEKKLGVTCANAYEVETKKAALESSDKRILLADSSKFQKVKIGYFAELKDFDLIITDSGIPGSYVSLLQNSGVDLILA